MRRAFPGIALAVCLAAVAPRVDAQAPAPGAKGAAPDQRLVESSFTKLTATVEGVDLAKREVTLREAGGQPFTISVDAAVTNLSEVKNGDVVVAKYSESLVYEVKAPGQAAPGAGVKVTGQSGKPGEKPKGVSTRQTTVTVKITAIDPKVPSVTYQGPKGGPQTMRVMDPAKLAGVKVGQTVELTYTEALAFSVEKAPKK